MYARKKELLYVQIFAKKEKRKKINQKLDAREQTTIKHLLLKNWIEEEVLETLNLKTFSENTKVGFSSDLELRNEFKLFPAANI